jgi:hypothetical protein
MKTIDGMDSALVGTADVWHPDGTTVERAVYSGDMIITILVDGGMDEDEAMEYCSFNIENAYVGEDTPIIFWADNICFR